MCHAPCHGDLLRKAVVSLVSITGQIATEFIPQEFCRMVATPGPFILEKDHPWGSAVFIRKILEDGSLWEDSPTTVGRKPLTQKGVWQRPDPSLDPMRTASAFVF